METRVIPMINHSKTRPEMRLGNETTSTEGERERETKAKQKTQQTKIENQQKTSRQRYSRIEEEREGGVQILIRRMYFFKKKFMVLIV
jgi:hypothetical protein